MVERGLGAAAIVVGRAVTRAAGALPRVVRKASGLEHPSPEAVAAGVVRGVTALAPASLPIAGRAVELAGVASVLALATWTIRAELDDEMCSTAIADAIADAERRGLCRARTALVWRMTAGVPVDGVATRLSLVPDVRKLGRSVVWSLSRKAVVQLLGTARPQHVLDAGPAVAGAWIAMGDAARLVDAATAVAQQEATRGAVVVRLRSSARAA